MIGALVEMSRFPAASAAQGDQEKGDDDDDDDDDDGEGEMLLDQAEALATGTLQCLVDATGILTETAFAPSHPNLDLVSAQFKGIFVRNLASLYSVRPRGESQDFLRRNAERIWERDRIPEGEEEKEGLLGAAWQGPVGSVSSAAQGSGVDCLVAAVGVGV